LIALGVWPFLLKIEGVANYFAEYKFLTMITPGEILYQAAIIVLGVLLIWTLRSTVHMRREG
jgi:hypothetical protein